MINTASTLWYAFFGGSDEAHCHCAQGESILQVRAAIFREQLQQAVGSAEVAVTDTPKWRSVIWLFCLAAQAAEPCCCLFAQIMSGRAAACSEKL